MSDWRRLLDPELESVLEVLPIVDFEDFLTFRAASDSAGAQRAAHIDIAGLFVDDRGVTARGRTARVRLYRPAGPDQGRPAILHIHGGGFVSGSPDSSHANMVNLACELDAVVVSVDYRRAPEHPYPAPLDDCLTALRWMAAASDELGIDSSRIAVHGISAGGALAAAVAIAVRDEIDLRFQFLSVPIIDDRLDSPSMRRFHDTPIWSRPVGQASWRHYLGQLEASPDEVPVTAAPGRATEQDLHGLPATYVAVMELDPLCDEGLRYAEMLAGAGVSVEAHRFPGAFHAAFISAPGSSLSRRYFREELDVLRRALEVRS